jgi:hypothetical protein
MLNGYGWIYLNIFLRLFPLKSYNKKNNLPGIHLLYIRFRYSKVQEATIPQLLMFPGGSTTTLYQ